MTLAFDDKILNRSATNAHVSRWLTHGSPGNSQLCTYIVAQSLAVLRRSFLFHREPSSNNSSQAVRYQAFVNSFIPRWSPSLRPCGTCPEVVLLSRLSFYSASSQQWLCATSIFIYSFLQPWLPKQRQGPEARGSVGMF